MPHPRYIKSYNELFLTNFLLVFHTIHTEGQNVCLLPTTI